MVTQALTTPVTTGNIRCWPVGTDPNMKASLMRNKSLRLMALKAKLTKGLEPSEQKKKMNSFFLAKYLLLWLTYNVHRLLHELWLDQPVPKIIRMYDKAFFLLQPLIWCYQKVWRWRKTALQREATSSGEQSSTRKMQQNLKVHGWQKLGPFQGHLDELHRTNVSAL